MTSYLTRNRIAASLAVWTHLAVAGLAAAAEPATITLDEATRQRCLEVLREGVQSEEFWPSIHAAEALTLAGHAEEVRRRLGPQLARQADDQRRCGVARELVRAGDKLRRQVMLDILAGDDPHGHVHAAESLYKVCEIGDGRVLRAALAGGGQGAAAEAETRNMKLQLMAAAALGRCGSPAAMAFLRQSLSHDDADVYHIAAWVLGRIGDRRDIEPLRRNLARCPDDLSRAYHEHALAALGDAAGMEALLRNLKASDAAIRTYAATFAGDARAVQAAADLKTLLDDSEVDVRVRAAQTLLVLAQPPLPDPREDISVLVYQATEKNPRYTEGSVLELADGSLLYATTEFIGAGSDFSSAQIVGRQSADGGRSWGPQRVLQENTGAQNVMSVTLRRIRGSAGDLDRVAMFYLEKSSFDDLDLLVRFSDDEAQSFGPAVRVTADDGYHVVNNDRVTQLTSGRLLAPASSTADVKKENHFRSRCYLSDDGGRTWRRGQGSVDQPKRGAMEPEVVELGDGRVLMIVRTQLGYIAKSYSADGGDTWSPPETLGLRAPEAPSTLRTVPATGDLLLIWNNTYTRGAGHGGRRTPLSAAVSSDQGRTWRLVGNLESRSDRTYSYTSLTFVRDRAVMSYWESAPEVKGLSSRFRSLPVGWFYSPSPSN